MTIQNFVQQMQEMLDTKDNSVILEWLEFVGGISDYCNTNLEDELAETIRALFYVKNNFHWDVFQKSLCYPSLSDEIINAAFCFCQGYSKDAISKFAEEGKLECGYIPKSKNETGSFSLIRNTDSNKEFFFAINESREAIEKQMRRLSILSEDEDVSIRELLNDKTINNMQIQSVGNNVLADAMCYTFTHSMAIRDFYDFSPIECCVKDISDVALEVIAYKEIPGTTDEEKAVRTSDTALEILRTKIADNLAGYEAEWVSISQWELMDRAEEISVIRMLAKVIPETITEEQAKYFVQFKNPLDVVTGSWMSTNSYRFNTNLEDDVKHTLWTVINEEDADLIYDMENPADDESAGFSMSM